MYSDTRPCEVCGSEVRLTENRTPTYTAADDTVDERICTNPECETNTGDRTADSPTP